MRNGDASGARRLGDAAAGEAMRKGDASGARRLGDAAAGEAMRKGDASGARRIVSGIYPGFDEDLLILAARQESVLHR